MIGEQLLDASPCVGALRVQPMTVDEIDAHPDAARIWATIVALRDAADADDERDEEIRELRQELDEEIDRPRADDLRERLRERLLADDSPIPFDAAEKVCRLIDEENDAL